MYQTDNSVPVMASSMSSPLNQFFKGVKDTFPLVVGAAPFAIIFGTLSVTSGLSFTAAMGMSLFVFAGASQFVCLGLIAAGTAWPMIVVTTFVVNLRHMLYGATMVPFYKGLNPSWKMLLAFGLTDETFAVSVRNYNQKDGASHKHFYNLGSMLFLYTTWNIFTLLGLTAGNAFPGISRWGLDFAMPATFIGIVIPYLITKPMWAAVVSSGVVSVMASGLPHKLGLMIAALTGVTAGIVCEKYFTRKRELHS